MEPDQLLEDVQRWLAARDGGEVVVLDSYTELQFGKDPEHPKRGFVVVFVERGDEEDGIGG